MTGGEEMSTKMKTEDGERPQRMKDWLIEQINSGKYEGLRWDDESKTVFRVPWIHAKKRGYDPSRDAALFKAWATHTGKYKGDGDATTWKINFRCALNGLKDIVELKEEQTENFRVYRLLPDTGRKRKHDRNSSQRRTDYPMEGGFPLCIPQYPAFIPYAQNGQPFMPLVQDSYNTCPEIVAPPWKTQMFTPFPPDHTAVYDSVSCVSKPSFGVALPHITTSETMANRVPCITGPPHYEPRPSLPPPYVDTGYYNEECPISNKRMHIKADPGIPQSGGYANSNYSDDGQMSPKEIQMKKDPTLRPVGCLHYHETPVYPEPHSGYPVLSHSPASNCSESPVNVEDSPPLQTHMTQSSPHNCPVTPPYHNVQGSNAVNSPTPVITPFIGPYDPLTPPQNATPPSGPSAVQISVYYNGVHRAIQTIACPHAGCRIFSDVVPQGSLTPHEIDVQLKAAFPFELPHEARAQHILEKIGRGLLLEIVNGDVYLRNHTQMPCFYGSSPAPVSHVNAIGPEMQEHIFSFASFKEALSQGVLPDNPPSPFVAISLGQPWGQGSPLSHASVTIVVTVLQAQSELQRLRLSVPQEQTFFNPHSQMAGYEDECQVIPPQALIHHSRPAYTPAVEP